MEYLIKCKTLEIQRYFIYLGTLMAVSDGPPAKINNLVRTLGRVPINECAYFTSLIQTHYLNLANIHP